MALGAGVDLTARLCLALGSRASYLTSCLSFPTPQVDVIISTFSSYKENSTKNNMPSNWHGNRDVTFRLCVCTDTLA